MRRTLTGIVALATALTPGVADALGLGEISLQSRIGHPLMAEVPIFTSSEETPLTACFSLAPIRGSDLPVITAAKTKLIRRGQNYVLQIFGSHPVSEPIFAISVQAGCNHSVVRDYVLLPEAPLMLADAPISSPPVTMTTRGRPTKFSKWHAREGETLEDVADAQAPADLVERERLIAALKRANPDISPDGALQEGSIVFIPRQKQTQVRQESQRGSQIDQPASDENRATKTRPSSRKPKPSPSMPGKGMDQVLLGAAPEDIKPRERVNSPPQSLAETEQRLLKLETTLHLLTQEVEKIDQALELTTKAIEVQNKLLEAQTPPVNREPVALSADSTQIATHTLKSSNWLELLLSGAAGAAISVGFAQYMSRRQRYPGNNVTPPVFANDDPREAEISSKARDMLPIELAPPPSTQEKTPRQPENIEVKLEDDDSVLALAEIMLSFGRVGGAVETLAEHIDAHIPENIQPWSMLLDLYRRGGMRQEFTELAAKMRTRFNASIPDWNDSSTAVSGLVTLERYPHVIQKASSTWGTQACLDYLLSLVHDTRAGQRNGFPLEVVEEIALLMRVLEDGYGLRR